MNSQKLISYFFWGLTQCQATSVYIDSPERQQINGTQFLRSPYVRSNLFSNSQPEKFFRNTNDLKTYSNAGKRSRSLSDIQNCILGSPLKKTKFMNKQDIESETSDFEVLTQEPVNLSDSSEILTQEPIDHLLSQESLVHESAISSASPEILTPPLIESINYLKSKYDVFIIDIVGVIHDGMNPFQNNIQVINNLTLEKTVALVSNTPRPHTQPAHVLASMGLNQNIPIFTAGDQVRNDLIHEHNGQKVYHLGAERNQDILKDLEVSTTPTLDHADIVLLTQYVDEDESLAEFDPLLKEIAARKLIVLCANSDKTASVGEKLRYCAGTLGAKIEDFKGIVRYYGKPHQKLFEKILEEIPYIKEVSKDRILIIGDTLEKDIKWGANNGVDSLLVLTGTTAQDIQRSGRETKEALKHFCKNEKVRPTYYTYSL